MSRFLITFPSVYHAFRAERLLGQNNINVIMVPVPRSLSGSCEGLAAQVTKDEIQAAISLLAKSNVNMLHQGIEVEDY